MSRRSTRNYIDLDKVELIDLKDFREACVKVFTRSPITSDAYRLASRFIDEISKACEIFTGDSSYFSLR